MGRAEALKAVGEAEEFGVNLTVDFRRSGNEFSPLRADQTATRTKPKKAKIVFENILDGVTG